MDPHNIENGNVERPAGVDIRIGVNGSGPTIVWSSNDYRTSFFVQGETETGGEGHLNIEVSYMDKAEDVCLKGKPEDFRTPEEIEYLAQILDFLKYLEKTYDFESMIEEIEAVLETE